MKPYKNEILIKYLNKYNIPKSIINKLLNNRNLQVDKIFPDNLLKIALSLKYGTPFTKIKRLLPLIPYQNQLELLKWKDQLLSRNLLILDNHKLIDPLSNQYFINFNKNHFNTKLYEISDILNIINEYYEQKNYEKVYELLSILLKSKNYLNNLGDTQKLFFFEIYGTTILNLFSERTALKTFKNLIKNNNEHYFYKFVAIILLMNKHYKFSYTFFQYYYNLILQKSIKNKNILRESKNIKFIMDLLEILKSETYKRKIKNHQ